MIKSTEQQINNVSRKTGMSAAQIVVILEALDAEWNDGVVSYADENGFTEVTGTEGEE